MKHMTSREFNHDIGKAKRAAEEGPVIVTDRGRPAYVLLKYEDYRKSGTNGLTMFDLLYDPEAGDFDFDPPRLQDSGPRSVEFD
ncbi:antitoxin [Labrys miyagiensis]|uniref:Antitoxin n=1 Tax=Labrys miyagiensis TaxID=346912 RepID=A0ABQ6CP05_9HYPH|nr:type II toxin-antitoxin system Phd/YefM family antitoxin [Labrys miyagiensis]GLS22106.1 antitoxin [Labrys miyagiensis]